MNIDDTNKKELPEMLPGRYVKISVSDTGIGMTQEVKNQIFEPFFSTKDEAEGTGLGLATTYGIIRNHSGHIKVESTPGHGTTFIVYLPISKKKVAAKRKVDPVTPTGNTTILLIYDEVDVRNFIKSGLESLGFKVYIATDGHHALNIFRKKKK